MRPPEALPGAAMQKKDGVAGNLFVGFMWLYLSIGGIISGVSFVSAAIYYSFGPGAFWNLGLGTSAAGFMFAAFFAFLRAFIWPLGIYQVLTAKVGLFPWLFYVWHQPALGG